MPEGTSKSASAKINNQENLESNIQIYRPIDHNLKRWGLFILGSLTLIIVTLFSVLLILDTYTSIQRHGRAVLLNNLPQILPLLFIGIPLGLALILYAKRHWDDRIVLEENKLTQYKGKKCRTWMYEETQILDSIITDIQFGGSVVGKRVKLQLDDGDQKHWTIRNRYEDISDLVANIRWKILPHLYNKTLHLLTTGEKIVFHPDLTVGHEGIEIKEHHLPWDKIPEPILKNNKLVLSEGKEEKPLFISKVKKIKNLDLLLCLLDNPPIYKN